MYCPRCNSYSCGCLLGMHNQMAAQQQMGMANAQHLAYLHAQLGRAVSDEMVKAYKSEPKPNKKLLLLRK